MSSEVPTKVAIVTGACSGMGLALTQHLLSSQTVRWRVVLADINEDLYQKISSTLDPERTIFQRTDVSKWEDDASLFKRAFQWSAGENGEGKGRIDFFASNAGISDQESMYARSDLEAEPVKPNLAAMEVNLLSAFYGLKLFVHYARKTRAHLPSMASFTPAMVITASAVGLYQFSIGPQYCAAKYGLLGLTRSVGVRLLSQDNLSVNAILPGIVATPFLPPGVIDQCPGEYVTPMTTILAAFDDLLKEEIVDGKAERKTGKCLEASEDKLYYRDTPEYSSEGMRWLLDDGEAFQSMMKGLASKRDQKVE
jgi:15-hydroxyprostaglandin dehydrogenase (NAD)